MAVITWVVLGAVAVISVVYIIAAVTAFDTLNDLYDRLENSSLKEDYKDHLENNMRGGMAACVLSMLCVIAYALLSFLFSMRNWFNEALLDGILFGVLLTSALYSSAFMLLVGVILQSNDLTVKDWMNDDDSDIRTYRFAYVMAYILVGIYFSLFIYHIWGKIVTNRDAIQENRETMVGPAMQKTTSSL